MTDMSGTPTTLDTRASKANKPNDRPFPGVYRRGKFYWIEFWRHGRQVRESSHFTNPREAHRLRNRRLQEVSTDTFIPKQEKVLMSELFDALVTDYKNNGRRTLRTLHFRLNPLKEAFGNRRAVDVSETQVERYKADRLADNRAPATVNRELAALKKAFHLGVRHKRLSATRVPHIDMLAENNVREGFLDPEAFRDFAGKLPQLIADIAGFAYLTAWRREAILSLGWPDVDLVHGRITLRRANSKNAEPVVRPMTPALRQIIERRWNDRLIETPSGPAVAEWVFHRNGRRVVDFRASWDAARKAIGQPTLRLHDFCRSAIRNMDRAGVSESVGMKASGRKTNAIYKRYRIVDEQDVREAWERTEATVFPHIPSHNPTPDGSPHVA